MKKLIFKILFIMVFIISPFFAAAQSPIIVENFNYTAADTLSKITSSGWTPISTSSIINKIPVVSPGLSYSGSTASAIGNAVAIKTTGEDIGKAFTQNYRDNAIYTSFLINVSAAQATGDYFFCFLDSTLNGVNYRARTFIKSSGTGFKIGVSKSGAVTAAGFYATDLSFNTTYQIVVKYSIITGVTNDSVKLFVNPVLGAAEPTTASADALPTETDITISSTVGIGGVALRQGTATNAPTLTFDGLIVGRTWSSVTTLNTSSGSIIPSYVPTNGLVGYWPFNGNANDESGNGNNGTVNGATLTSDKLGSSNGAYSFDGVNDYISTLLPGPLGNSSRTISIWFSSQDTSKQQLIGWGQQPPSGGEFNVLLSQLCKGVTVDVHNNYITYNTPNNLFNGSWHLITVVYDNNISLKLLGVKIYVDGVISGVINCQNPINVNINTLNTAINIGKYQAGGMWFTGKLDDIGIWNRALTQSEITSLYTQNYVAQIPSYVPTNGLVGYWPFNGNANDASGNGNNGTVNGSILTNDRFGKPSAAYSFDGSSNYIDVPNSSSFNFTKNKMTVSLWMLTTVSTPVNNVHTLISKQSSSGANQSGFNIAKENTLTYLLIKNGPNTPQGYSRVPSTSLLNSWHNLVCVADSGILKTYIDGQLIKTDTTNAAIGLSTQALRFGKPIYSIINSEFNGSLDDIGIWNRALTEQEITNLYNGNICFETVRVTDTLVINVNRTGYNPITYSNTIKVYPNPANNKITIDNGDIQKMNGYSIKIINSLGQQVYQGGITQQIVSIDITQWAGNGMYYLQLTDNNGNIVDVKKIVLQ